MDTTPHILLVFVDGLGIGPSDPNANPIQPDVCPCLVEILARHAKPIDATLGVLGPPQSATGQTAILTGINAAQKVGRHVEGFPPRMLKEIVREHSIFQKLSEKNVPSTFANAYFTDNIDDIINSRIQSVTTVATLGAFGTVRMTDAMLAGDAVYQDITREALRPRGYDGPIISPTQAAADLARIAKQHAFTLFEYFQSDRAGHTADLDRAEVILTILDEFFSALLPLAEQEDILFILTSDHGNIEDLSTIRHTLNPVPFVTRGPGAESLRDRVTSILDITPACLEIL